MTDDNTKKRIIPNDVCVCCESPVPEGVMICPVCESMNGLNHDGIEIDPEVYQRIVGRRKRVLGRRGTDTEDK